MQSCTKHNIIICVNLNQPRIVIIVPLKQLNIFTRHFYAFKNNLNIIVLKKSMRHLFNITIISFIYIEI